MTIEIKISKNPVEYNKAINFLEKRLTKVINKKSNELIWLLEHPSIYTGGKRYKKNEIINNKIKIIKTNRGGKITWHGPGQIICYFVIDLNKRNRDIRKFIILIEKTIINTLSDYKIKSFADRNNIGIWVKKDNVTNKVAALGFRIKKWIVYHGFSLNVRNNLKPFVDQYDNYEKAINLKTKKLQNSINLNNDIVNSIISIRSGSAILS